MIQENNMYLIDIYTPTNQRWIFWPTTLKIKQKTLLVCIVFSRHSEHFKNQKKVYYPQGVQKGQEEYKKRHLCTAGMYDIHTLEMQRWTFNP